MRARIIVSDRALQAGASWTTKCGATESEPYLKFCPPPGWVPITAGPASEPLATLTDPGLSEVALTQLNGATRIIGQ